MLLQQGAAALGNLLQHMTRWMEQNEYESVAQLKGCLSYANAIDPAAFERANYAELLGAGAWLKADLNRFREE